MAEITKVQKPPLGEEKFSIIIPTWNNLEYLKLCARSIEENSEYQHQLIILVNEGSDGTKEWVEKSGYSYIFSSENIGICFGVNSCRSLARTDYLLYINDDMYACPGWDKPLADEIDSIGHNNFYLSGTMIEPDDTGNKCAVVGDYGRGLEDFDEAGLKNEFGRFEKSDWQGGTWPPSLVHINLWDIAGGLSTEFSPGMYSDPDFSRKLWEYGVRYFKGLAKSRVYHFGSKSTKRASVNSGGNTFLFKWGITSRTFTQKYLRSGEKFDGPLKEPHLSWQTTFKNRVKRLLLSFTSAGLK